MVRPNEAPMAMDGTNIPAGTLQPYDMITKKILRNVAIVRDDTIDHRFLALGTH